MVKKVFTLFLGLIAGSALAFNIRTLTGSFINAGGGIAITTGYVAVTAQGAVPATIPNGVLVPMPPYNFPILNGVLACNVRCAIIAPANYRWDFYDTSGAGPVKVWTFVAGVPDVSGAITVQEIYANAYVVTSPPNTVMTVTGGPQGPIGPQGIQGIPGVVITGGTPGELQYNNSGSIGGMAGSVVSGQDLSLTGTLTAPYFAGSLVGNADTATLAANATDATLAATATTAVTATTATTAIDLAPGAYTYDGSGTVTMNAATALGLAAAPTNCTGNDFALGITANGTANCAQVTYANLGGVVPTWNQDTSGNAATATLAATATTTGIAQNVDVVAVSDSATYFPLFAAVVSGSSAPNATGGFTYQPSTGTLTTAKFAGALVGNADTVTSGLYSTGSYSDPAWLASLSGAKITGNISGQAGSVLDGVTTTGSYSNPAWLTSVLGSIVSGDIAGQAGSAVNGVVTTGSYSDPAWIASLAGTKITGDITGQAGSVPNGVVTTGSYPNPSWLTSVAGAKITGNIAGNSGTATALATAPTVCSGNNFSLGIDVYGTAQCSQPSFAQLSGTATWAQVSKSGALVTDLGSGVATNGQVPIADGFGNTNWGTPAGGSGGGWTPPAGTGYVYILGGVMQASATLVTDSMVAAGAAIGWSKIDKTGAVPGDVGAAPTAQGISSATGTAPLTLAFSANALTGSIADTAAGTKGVIALSGDLGGTAVTPTVATVGGSTAANVHTAEVLANAATSSNTANAIVARDASGNFTAGTITAALTGNVTGSVTGNAGTVTGGVYTSRQVIAGTGLSGGGALSGDVTLNLSSPVTTVLGGTGVNLSASGPGYLKQATAGANVTVGGISIGDLPTSGTWTLLGGVTITGAGLAFDSLTVSGAVGLSTLPMNVAPGNGKAWGITMTAQYAGESLAQGAVVYLAADGDWYNAKADASATSGPVALGVCPVAIGSGSTGVILIEGVVQITGWGLTTGALYYVDPNAAGNIIVGGPSSTGQQIRAVGHALASTTLFFHPSVDWGEHQ